MTKRDLNTERADFGELASSELSVEDSRVEGAERTGLGLDPARQSRKQRTYDRGLRGWSRMNAIPDSYPRSSVKSAVRSLLQAGKIAMDCGTDGHNCAIRAIEMRGIARGDCGMVGCGGGYGGVGLAGRVGPDG